MDFLKPERIKLQIKSNQILNQIKQTSKPNKIKSNRIKLQIKMNQIKSKKEMQNNVKSVTKSI